VGPEITGTIGLSALATVLTEFGTGSTQHAKVLVDPARDEPTSWDLARLEHIHTTGAPP
jgi:hypothetical protein